MQSRAFISHAGHSHAGRIIKEQLENDLDMEAFFSIDHIEFGDQIMETILENLVKTDIFFMILNYRSKCSEWVRWEYCFCRERDIKIIPVVSKKIQPRLPEITWFDSSIKYIENNRIDDDLTDDVGDAITESSEMLEQRALARKRIRIDAEADKAECPFDGEVAISGTAQGPVGAAYVHHPVDGNGAPHSRYVTGLKTDSHGRFWFKLKPDQVVGSRTDKIFVEIKFGPKSKLIQIAIRGGPAAARTAPARPGAPGGVVQDPVDMEQKMSEISRGTIRGIPATIRNETIPLDDRVSDIEKALAKRGRVAVTGEKGSGKSVLLCKVYERLAKNRPAFFVRCDDHMGAASFEDLDKDIVPGLNFADALHDVARRAEPVVIFDSIDAISRNKKAMNALRHMLKKIWGNGRIQTVVSVRSYDYEYSSSISATDWGEEYVLKPLGDPELARVLKDLGDPNVPGRLKRLLYNPFRLKLLSLILEKAPGADFASIRHEADLYEMHWHECVEKDDSASDTRDMLYGVSQKMTASQHVSIPYEDFGNRYLMDQICSKNILNRNDGLLGFFHHAYLDYVMSRSIIERGDVVKSVSEAEYNVFLRPTIVFTLSLLHKRDPARFVNAVERMLKSNIKYFWKISSLTAVSQINDLGGQDFSEIGRLLTENKLLQRHFLIEAEKQANPLWFELWKGTAFAEWVSDPGENAYFLITYMRSIREKVDGEGLFRAVQEIVSRLDNVYPQRNAVELAAGLEADGLAEWMSKMATNENVHVRDGLAKSLPRLLDACPQAVPGIFCDLFTYEETSKEKTTAASHGTFNLTSNLRQDNMMVIWQMGELFPELLKKNPELMVRAAIRLFERILPPMRQRQEGDIIEDGGMYYPDIADPRYKIIQNVEEYAARCPEEELRRLAPIIHKTRLATFRALLLDAMVARKEKFKQEIWSEISRPQAYRVGGMTGSLCAAIAGAAPMLDGEQMSGLLDIVMKLTDARGAGDEGRVLIRKAKFLSAFPQDLLGPDHLDVLARCPKPGATGSGPEIAWPEITERTEPKNSMKRYFDGELDLPKTDVLTGVLERLKDEADLDPKEVSDIRRLLSDSRDDPDPAEDSEDDPGNFITCPFTVRGLVAECAAIMIDRCKDASLVPLVRHLSKDPSSIVRGDVCKSLWRLASYDYDLAYEIGLEYSLDRDRRVQFFIPDMLRITAGNDISHALRILENIVGAGNKSEHVGAYLLYLSLAKSEPRAASLLDAAIDGTDSEICMHLPFYLKPYIAEFQDKALDLFYRLLADPDHHIREKACFFLLRWAEDSADDGLPQKIERHLDRIASETEHSPCDPRLLEELAKFLAKKWERMPGKSLEYLEKIAGMGRYAAGQPVLAEETLKVLSGLLHQPLPEKEAQRCLDVLDTYAMAGWPDAFGLLSAMEKRD